MRFVLILFLSLPASGASYFIDATGGNDANAGTSSGAAWKTLVHGQTNVVANDFVFLKRGETWYEAWTNRVNGITLDAYGSGALPILDGGSSNRWGVLCSSTSNTFTHNLYIRNFGGTAPPNDTGALWETDAAGTNTITDCVLDHHLTDDNVGANSGWSIVQRCTIINAFDQGVTSHGTGNAIVESCTISNCLEAFKNSTTGGQLIVNDCTIVQNTLSDVDDLTATVAVFNRCKFNGRNDASAWAFIKANEASLTFNYCVFDASHSSSGLAGPQFTTQQAPVFLNNCVFYGNGIGSIVVGTSQTLAATNCIFKDWWRAAFLNSGASFLANHCIFTNITTGTRTETQTVSTSDPKFVSASGGDFHLQAGSPGIGTGINIGLPLDLDRNAVASPPSVGVFEFNTNSVSTTMNTARAFIGRIIKSP